MHKYILVLLVLSLFTTSESAKAERISTADIHVLTSAPLYSRELLLDEVIPTILGSLIENLDPEQLDVQLTGEQQLTVVIVDGEYQAMVSFIFTATYRGEPVRCSEHSAQPEKSCMAAQLLPFNPYRLNRPGELVVPFEFRP